MGDDTFRPERAGARPRPLPIVPKVARSAFWLAAAVGAVLTAVPAQAASFIGAGPPPIHVPPPVVVAPPRAPVVGTVPRFGPTLPANPNPGGGNSVNSSGASSGGNNGGSRNTRAQRLSRRTTNNNNNGVPPAGERRYIPDQVLIEVNGSLSARHTALFNRLRVTRIDSRRIALINTTFHTLRITDGGSVTAKIRALNASGLVRAAQPNYLFALTADTAQALAEAPDPGQYALAKLHLDDAHHISLGDNVLVAIIDSGIDTAHPALAGIVAKSFDALTSSEGPHTHGTAIAGIIAGHGHLSGAAPAVHILAARAFSTTQGSTMSIIASLDWAVGEHARVVNMSFAGPADPALERTLAAAHQKGVVLVAATGNAGPKSPPLWPAADPHVIGVTATDFDDHLFAMANRGRQVAIAAPGVDILVANPGNAYKMETGTSFSAAFVTGVAALMIQRDPRLTPARVEKVLLATAHDLGPKGRDEMFGAGLMDAFQAVSAVTKATDAALQLQH
jgi:subtilisin family serine protease